MGTLKGGPQLIWSNKENDARCQVSLAWALENVHCYTRLISFMGVACSLCCCQTMIVLHENARFVRQGHTNKRMRWPRSWFFFLVSLMFRVLGSIDPQLLSSAFFLLPWNRTKGLKETDFHQLISAQGSGFLFFFFLQARSFVNCTFPKFPW